MGEQAENRGYALATDGVEAFINPVKFVDAPDVSRIHVIVCRPNE